MGVLAKIRDNIFGNGDEGEDVEEIVDPYTQDPTVYIEPNPVIYDIILIRPRTVDDMNYVVDQIVHEKNPVILDLIYMQNDSAESYQMAGAKIKMLRENYHAEAISISKTEDKNLILLTPSQINIIKKD
ncbi:MAG: cell division protein SepF [Methanobrevibacter sp.]|jgi:SepF-like predicted cell division protein (DUF552 family)|nr:cell division protein SepF [Candidatus Methanoflexus mossambicus]